MFQKVLPLWIRLWSAILSMNDISANSVHHEPSTDLKNGDNPPVMTMKNGKITPLTISKINKHVCSITTQIQAKLAATLPETWFYTITNQKIEQPEIMTMKNGKITLLTISQINKHVCLTTTQIQAKPAATPPKTWFYTTHQKIAQPEIMTHLHHPSHEIGIKNKPWPSLACSIPRPCTQGSTLKYSMPKKRKKRSYNLVRDLRERAIYKIILSEWAVSIS